ncbi:uncharacterized protein FFUJ_11259 [Fusarium fujikuroi IMI 58289]|uniref:Zn(2)-C6 fungal-type domain-containing protein n=1 Tax=Gibberella fujikuroi (strain CBS 195.34 / IMI 58289 / NRRL A-6831) TaxID=1279085 RepID=S0EK89_GIBF5|nr:uncharacterized protein FFUJ_11259 [Fusarium fujikuroi IMI 58289]KLP01900.1 uncharacterized protein LW94_2569 [Fusarium fujikuroi]QGI87905.1 hypothetical protein CEK25_002861 [Fusarium fujikuroi]CCT75236.1 uncharacterized protein FFUJ_11259 [Fusarium fujikuroi IMI 58289]SCO25583.1 uncharacterized protein FFM5_14173 [Fusarium fujikuroi]SCO56678.1 uncharacterized protein FFMR_13834 [Fusarium fujikuroi]
MGVSAPHPSQRRFSCDVCRKSKSRCQRIKPTDEKCARCSMLGVKCEIGQQKVPGRPRRKQAGKGSPPAVQHLPVSKPVSPNALSQNATLMDDWSPFDWTGMLSPKPSPPQMPATAIQDGIATSWGIGFTDIFDQSQTSWNLGGDLEYTNTPLCTDLDTITNLYPVSISPDSTITYETFFPLTNCLTTHQPRKEDPGAFMADLSTINLGLHIRLEAMKKTKPSLDFDLMIYQHGPLFIDGITLAEYIIKVAQEFLYILTKLYNTRHCPELLCDSQPMELICPCHLSSELREKSRNLFDVSLPRPTVTSEPLPTPIALMITSIFIQLITIYELILDNIATRVERIATDPIEPVPGLIVCGRPLERPCTQGMIFCEVSVSLIENIERVLGVGRGLDGKEVGLLSLRQVDVLGKELDERPRVIPDHAMMTPAMLRKLLGKVADIFRSIRA